MSDRFVNKKRTQEKYLSDPNVSMWGFTEEELVRLGWLKSDEPLRLSTEDCIYCEGSGYYSTLGSISLHCKCQRCDGTGKNLL